MYRKKKEKKEKKKGEKESEREKFIYAIKYIENGGLSK